MALDGGSAVPGPVRVLFDVTRLLARAGFSTPTGIDRVDLEYLKALGSSPKFELHLVVFDPLGGRALGGPAARALIDASTHQWDHFDDPRSAEAGKRLHWFLRSPAGTPRPAPLSPNASELPRLKRLRAGVGRTLRRPAEQLRLRHLLRGNAQFPTVYVNTSHGHIYRAASARWLGASHLGRVFMVHDMIPIEFPQFNRPREPDRHRARVRTIAAHASHVITNSAATANALSRYLVAENLRVPPITPVHLGIGSPFRAARPDPAAPSAVPYFVCVGTLEPRKNHHLLLDVWKHLIQDGQGAPRLVLIGRRGWENEALFHRLDHDRELAMHVVECSGLGDAEIRSVLSGARALLSPSFTEGFGLPVAEALASGIPTLVSSIAAHREIGQEYSEYLPATSTQEWIAAIRDYAAPASERRRSRIERLHRYRAPSWDAHFQVVLQILREAASDADASATP